MIDAWRTWLSAFDIDVGEVRPLRRHGPHAEDQGVGAARDAHRDLDLVELLRQLRGDDLGRQSRGRAAPHVAEGKGPHVLRVASCAELLDER